jgi:hypothetical protein
MIRLFCVVELFAEMMLRLLTVTLVEGLILCRNQVGRPQHEIKYDNKLTFPLVFRI